MEEIKLIQLSQSLELDYGLKMRSLYATDASVYRQLPLAVAFPKNEEELQILVNFASKNETSLIPRSAGTSLAGQCVGDGIVVDTSRYFTNIIEINKEDRWVKLQPGVIRDDLNRLLADYGLFFSPNTSTSNRCMIGGMVGNNSSGSTSIRYGVTRDKVKKIRCVLSDGSIGEFQAENNRNLNAKMKSDRLADRIHKDIFELLESPSTREDILRNYPDSRIRRRNTGYALDEFITGNLFDDSNGEFDLNKLLTGSEGTLALTTEITLSLDLLPPKLNAMVVAHFDSIPKCLSAVVPAMGHRLFACEMMDKTILDCTKNNATQKKNRFFIEGDPEAILMLEVKANDEPDLSDQISKLISTIDDSGLCYAKKVLYGEEVNKGFELRKAGLGVLANLNGRAKAVACIEDTAVKIEDLVDYIGEFAELMKSFNQKPIYYAHAGAGELHLRPILDLRNQSDRKDFREISQAVAMLVKKYNGSLSGEHGDGRVRAEFIPEFYGPSTYEILKRVKEIFDPKNIFNPGKIVYAVPMHKQLRYAENAPEEIANSFFDFSKENGILSLAEKCNGSGDCRKSPASGGGMCPSYHVTKEEQHTTRGRANMLREILSDTTLTKHFDSKELQEVFDLCVGCKACASECPSNVDVAILKSEFLYQYQLVNGRKLRDRIFANNYRINKVLKSVKSYHNLFLSTGIGSGMVKNLLGIAKKRSMPLLSGWNLKKELKFLGKKPEGGKQTLFLFLDEFSSMYEVQLIVKSIELLQYLGYTVKWTKHEESGRSMLSKGFLPEAQKIAEKNVAIFSQVISDDVPLIGIEPSAILSFRDEYARLVGNRDKANQLAKNCFLIEEFISEEIDKGNIRSDQFDQHSRNIKVHVHCHQKALSGTESTVKLLSLPVNHEVELIESGCCGMAGSFGYEERHYETSVAMAEVSLLPKIRTAQGAIIVANGTSCRHQIKDLAGQQAKHPIELLWEARIK